MIKLTIIFLLPVMASANVVNPKLKMESDNTQTHTLQTESKRQNKARVESPTEIQPSIDTSESLNQQMQKGEDFSQALTYRDLYRENVTVAQKWGILKNLREQAPDFAKKTYLSCLQSTDWFLRLGGIKYLASVDAKQAIQEAKQLLLEDASLLVRSGAADVLMKEGLSLSKGVLWQALEDEKNFHRGQSLWIRKNIAKGLRHASDQSDNQMWSKFLDDKDKVVKANAVSALERNNELLLGETSDSIGKKANLWKEKLLSQAEFLSSPNTDLMPEMSSPSGEIDSGDAAPVDNLKNENKNSDSPKNSKAWDIIES